jgi:hypothetical protein
VLHIPSEYDYFLGSQKKDDFIEILTKIKNNEGEDPLNFYLVEDIDLNKYTKKEGEQQDRYPPVQPQVMNCKQFQSFREDKQKNLQDDIKNTEVIMSPDGQSINQDNFEFLRSLGKGYFGRVFLVEKKDDKQLFALKVIRKLDIVKRNFFDNLKNEKKIMEQVKNPFVVNMEYCFASPVYIFFAMKFK